MYEVGYTDQLMTWTENGPEAQYRIYKGHLYQLLERPHAVAFISRGGVYKFVAEAYSPDLVQQGSNTAITRKGSVDRLHHWTDEHAGGHDADQTCQGQEPRK
ncbi:hypothetical protein C8R45DRAFT_942556 [Mycena sanguinolenta]|nr:hypothetical protein C8R45DRAFT_942556 [Mycena sanguinolenta]